jgi:helix-turn-helix protein
VPVRPLAQGSSRARPGTGGGLRDVPGAQREGPDRRLARCTTVNDILTAAIEEMLTPLVRRLVREELARAAMLWQWRTPAEAGALLGISAAAVRQRVLRGQLPAKRLEGRLYFDIQDLDRAIQDGSYHARPHHVTDKWAERCANSPGPDDQGGNP